VTDIEDRLKWDERLGQHFLIDAAGRVLAKIRRNSEGLYESRYGDQPLEEYIDLTNAREAMMARFREGKEAPPLKAKVEKKVEKP